MAGSALQRFTYGPGHSSGLLKLEDEWAFRLSSSGTVKPPHERRLREQLVQRLEGKGGLALSEHRKLGAGAGDVVLQLCLLTDGRHLAFFRSGTSSTLTCGRCDSTFPGDSPGGCS